MDTELRSDELEGFADSQKNPKSRHHPMPTYQRNEKSCADQIESFGKAKQSFGLSKLSI